MKVQEVLKQLSYNKIYREKIKSEFSVELSSKENAESVYYQLHKERQLYIHYGVAAGLLNDSFWDFYKATVDVVGFIQKWEDCTLHKDNYQSFSALVEQALQEKLKVDTGKCSDNFSCIFAAPANMKQDLLYATLKVLCRINASTTLRLFFERHSGLNIDFTDLLREAISCLHSETVKVLVEAGANIQDYFATPAYQDQGMTLLMPPLFYAVWLPYDPYCALHRDKPQISWDNPKLSTLITTLVSLGADPKQSCQATPYSNNKTVEASKTDYNTILLANEILDHADTDTLNMGSVAFLKMIVQLPQKTDLNIEIESSQCESYESPVTFI